MAKNIEGLKWRKTGFNLSSFVH